MQFAQPNMLFLLLALLPVIGWYVWKLRKSNAALGVSSIAAFSKTGNSWKSYLRHICFALNIIAAAALIIVLARPQSHGRWNTSKVNGTDIILAIDTSSSMLAKDFNPDRLTAAKNVATKFINGRPNDNIGIVIFAGESLTGIPLTNDRGILNNYVNEITYDMLEDGTAIGDGLATSINRLIDSKAKSKSIILLTDGSNNAGIVTPITAAQIAQKENIKVYTIGVGKEGNALYPYIDMFGRTSYASMPVHIDENTLKQIASMTGGKYFRATSDNTLKDIFSEIDQLETTEIDVRNFTRTDELYLKWAILALICVASAALMKYTILRSIP